MEQQGKNQEAQGTLKEKKGISGSTLKIIAIIVMLIDHIAAIILDRLLLSRGLADLDRANPNAIMEFMQANGTIYYIDMAMRMVGRIGFPIFCFLLVEGFVHTRNIKKYAFNLGVFSLLSEIPFDLAFQGTIWYPDYQNVFFTLFLGLLVLMGFKYVSGKSGMEKVWKIVLHGLILTAGAALGFLLKTDYAGYGVAVIAIMYLLRKWKMRETAAGCAVLCTMSIVTEISAFFSLIPIHLYNGKRGFRLKYAFYIFYPAHILILHFITVLMGIA